LQQTGSHTFSFFEVQVARIRSLTPDAVEIALYIPGELKPHFDFVPGQHLMLEVCLDGNTYRRSYSLCNAPGEPLTLAVKRMPGGIVSNFLVTRLKVGDLLRISTPVGSFRLDAVHKHVVLIGAGSGITPLLSMFRNGTHRRLKMSLLYGNQSPESTMFWDEFNSFNPSARVTHFFSQAHETGCFFGRINGETLSSYFTSYPEDLRAEGYYLCGPSGMIDSVRAYLETQGISSKRIHSEYFSAPEDDNAGLVKNEISKSQMCVILEGDRYEVQWHSSDATMLESIRKDGINAPFSCKKGVCGSCRAKVSKGSVNLFSNYALTEEEIQEGYILTCQCVPTSEILEVSFDE
jgi:ring-1,2-phenylacetyl-CoA epoxidase subunit PaaE